MPMPEIVSPSLDPLEFSETSFTHFCQLINTELGIKMSPAKQPMLKSRLQRRLRELRLGSIEEYRRLLFDSDAGEEERVHFFDAVTTNKTDFFREPHHFDFLTGTALPLLDEGAAAGAPCHFRVWCAGCSSGEEPYTLAMVLAEYAAKRPGFDFSILATDISTRVLEHASLAIYDMDRVEPVPPALCQRYLLRSRDAARNQVRVVPALRRRVQFRRLNFMDASYDVRGTFDVVFFRNVMIYFSKATQQAVIGRLCRHLVPGGFFFTGHSESLTGLDVPVDPVGSAIYRKPE